MDLTPPTLSKMIWDYFDKKLGHAENISFKIKERKQEIGKKKIQL